MRSVEESLRIKTYELERVINYFKDELDYKDFYIQQLKQVFYLLLFFIKWMMQVFQATGKRWKKKLEQNESGQLKLVVDHERYSNN